MHTKTPHILVVGGAGYIGSHMVLQLQQAGYQPLVLDNLSSGHRDAVGDAPLIVGEMSDKKLLSDLFQHYNIAAVMHFASHIEVSESITHPAKYYQNNVAATLNLLDVMLLHQVKKIIFSSTAAVYGEPQYTPMDEKHVIAPINPYGRSKSMVEAIINDYASSDGLCYAILRYFNAAGADPSGLLSERHTPESHLIPLLLQVARGERSHLTIYGQDYPTDDGTCIRDYVHVSDICAAHCLALDALQAGQQALLCNLGSGIGYSVQQVIQAVRHITSHAIPVKLGARRAGDPAILLADNQLAKRLIHWQPRYLDLNTIVRHAWMSSSQACAAVQ